MSALDIAYLGSPDPASQSTRIESLLHRMGDATARGDLEEALRLADAARRIAPAGEPTVALVYARVLIDLGRAEQALAVLDALSQPDALAARAEALCRLGRIEEAVGLCTTLIASQAVDCVEGLDRALDLAVSLEPGRFCGWAGVDSAGQLVGSLPSGSTLRWGEGASQGSLELARGDNGAPAHFRVPDGLDLSQPLPLSASCGAVLGSPLLCPADFGYSGWAVIEQEELRGEVLATWSPGRQTTLVLARYEDAAAPEDEQAGRSVVVLPAAGAGATVQGFALPLPTGKGERISIGVRLCDGRVKALAGSPFDCAHPAQAWPIRDRPPRGRGKGRSVQGPESKRVDIVVPVYAGLEESLRCIQSVLDTVPADQASLIVVDDASPDAELAGRLRKLAAEGRLTLVVNERNLGFPGAANRGMRIHPERDVVLLNADCEVYGDWLARLRAAAYSSADIASVTPLGEEASIASYAVPTIESRPLAASAGIDELARKVNAGRVVDVPVGVGFCLYLRRACLHEIGEFDEIAYGRGYGEENDLCLRARHGGWRHVVAADVFVRHAGGRSFGEERRSLMAHHGRLLNVRYPGYDALVAAHAAEDPLQGSRRAIDFQCLRERLRAPVLLVTHALGGGIQRVVDRRADELVAQGHSVLMMQPRRQPRAGVRLMLRGADFRNLEFDLPSETSVLAAAMQSLNLARMEIHHLLEVPAPVLDLLPGLEVPYEIFLHDYSWICPRLTLLGGSWRYCGEPSLRECEECVRTHGTAYDPPIGVGALRRRSARLIARAQQVRCASFDTRARYARYFPASEITVTPWEEVVAGSRRPALAPGSRVRVAVIGAINVQKGLQVLHECALDAARRDLPLEFVLIGFSSDDALLLQTGRVFVTGPYGEQEMPGLIAEQGCHLALFPAVAPETWCFTLSHALADGLPIVAFDIGAVAERLRGHAGATLLPLTTPFEKVNEQLLRIAGAEFEAKAAPEAAAPVAQPVPAAAQAGLPAPAPREAGAPPDAASAQGPAAEPAEQSASVQMLRLPPGVYVFSIRSGAPEGEHGDDMAMPSLHVGHAPVRPHGTVDFFCGPRTIDRWLAHAGDSVIARVSGESAAILLTSVRRPRDSVMAIDVRRVDVPLADEPGSVPGARIMAHVRQLGDLFFPAEAVGPFGTELWIEAFVVDSADGNGAQRFEYRGVTADGFETPWLSDAVLCGRRGRGTPLLGFAVRPRVAFHKDLECSYYGHFSSGRCIGPLGDGRLCRSDAPDDPLEGIELRVKLRG